MAPTMIFRNVLHKLSFVTLLQLHKVLHCLRLSTANKVLHEGLHSLR